MKAFLKSLAAIGAALLLLLAVSFFTVWAKPNLVLHDGLIDWAARFAKKRGIVVSWNSRRLDARSESFWKKKLSLHLRDVCLKMRAPEIQACFSEFDLSLEANLYWTGPYVSKIGPIHVVGNNIHYRLADENKAQAKNTQSSSRLPKVPSWLDRAKVADVQIRSPWTIMEGNKNYSGRLDLSGVTLGNGVRWVLNIDENLREKALQHTTGIHFEAENLNSAWASGPWLAKGVAKYNSKAQGQKLVAELKIQSQQLEIAKLLLHVRFRDALGRSIESRIDGTLRQGLLGARIDASLSKFNPSLSLVQLEHCPVVLSWKPGNFRDAELKVDNCRTWASYLRLQDLSQKYRVRIAKRIGLMWQVALNSFIDPSKERPLKVHALVNLDALENELLDIAGHTNLRLTAQSYQFAESMNLSGDAEVNADVKDYQVLVRVLNGNGILIPAPLHKLQGKIHLGVKGEGDWRNKGFVLPVNLETNLSSEEQRLKVKALGQLTLSPRDSNQLPNLKMDVLAQDVLVALPRLEMREPPPMIPDARIRRKAPPTKSSLAYEVHLHTAEAKPLLISSNLTKTPVPLDIDMSFRNDRDPEGSVWVRNYSLDLFRRKALVEKLGLKIAKTRELDGKIRFDYPQYTIWVLAVGTQDQPRIKFMSEPPLPEEEIASVLLFGEPMQSLDAGGKSSASNVTAALARGTLGLASLYFLASTPIENVNYDPSTGEVYAQLRLGHSTSLNVGVKSDQVESVGVTKRLGKRWRINTAVGDSSNPAERKLSSFLEWFLNY